MIIPNVDLKLQWQKEKQDNTEEYQYNHSGYVI